MAERRSKGLCYFCYEPYSPNHALTHKKLEIHVLEVSDTKEEIVVLNVLQMLTLYGFLSE